jgi:ATP-dependent helicase HrpA
LRVLSSEQAQEVAMIGGTRKLLEATLRRPGRLAERALAKDARLAIGRFSWGTAAQLVDECVRASVAALAARHGAPAWEEADFRKLQERVGDDLDTTAVTALAVAGDILVAAWTASARLDGLTAASVKDSVIDARSQLARLIRPGFVVRAGAERLPHVLRYVKGIDRRLDKLPADPAKDLHKLKGLLPLEEAFDRLLGRDLNPRSRRELAEVGWMLEEYRVSLFAQMLGTAYPISDARIRKELTRIASGVTAS